MNTLVIAFASATAVMLLTAISAWLTVRKAPGARILDNLGTAPLVFPGIVLGVGVMQFFLHVPVGIYGTVGSSSGRWLSIICPMACATATQA